MDQNNRPTITTLVEMSMEEAVDLHDKALCEIGTKFEHSFFTTRYKFVPLGLSDLMLVDCDPPFYLEDGKNFFTDGNVYIARKSNDKIEVKRLNHTRTEEVIWRSSLIKKARELFSNGPGISGIKMYQLFSRLDQISFEKIPGHCFCDSFSISAEGECTLDEIAVIPIWNKPGDYELFLRKTYGDEAVQEKLRKGEKFEFLAGAKEISHNWEIITACISPHYPRSYPMYNNIPFKRMQNLTGSFQHHIVKGMITIEQKHSDEKHNTLVGNMLADYVKPSRIESGVLVMNMDRIPMYLKRQLGIK